MKVSNIELTKITEMASALRKHDISDQQIIDLAVDINHRGLMNIFSVVNNEDGTYTLADGARRFTALKRIAIVGIPVPELDKNGEIVKDEKGRNVYKKDKDGNEITTINDQFLTIPVQIKEKQDELTTLEDQIAGNISVQLTKNADYIKALHKLAVSGKYKNRAEMALKNGMSEAHLNKLLKTMRLDNDIIDKCYENQVPVGNLISLSELANKVDDEVIIEEWIPKAKEMNAKDFIKEVGQETARIQAEQAGMTVEKKEKSFEVKPKLLSKDELEAMLQDAEDAFLNEDNPENEVRLQVMKEIWQIDEDSVRLQKEAWDKKEEEKKVKAEQKKAQKELAKLEEIAKKNGLTLTKN